MLWKQFWKEHQNYQTICLQCISKRRENERAEAIIGLGAESNTKYPDWGSVFLDDASKAILINWYRSAHQQLFRNNGRHAIQIDPIDISDDEDDGSLFSQRIDIGDRTKSIAITWVREARAKIQKERGWGR